MSLREKLGEHSFVQESKESREFINAENRDSKNYHGTENSSEDDTESEISAKIKPPDDSMEQSMTESNNNDEKQNERYGSSNDNADLLEKCNTCGQFLNNSDLLFYEGHPQDAEDEVIVLANNKLAFGKTADIKGDRPHINIMGFSIYDKAGHLLHIDSGLIEMGVPIYMSGYLKSICSDSHDIDEDVTVKDVGPILTWSVHGFDGGDRNYVAITTAFGVYNLLKPSDQYKPLRDDLYERILVTKVVVKYLEENNYLQPSYEELLEVIRSSTIVELNDKPMTEEILLKHSQFVCEQVSSLEADEDEQPLIALPCMEELIKLMGIQFDRPKTQKMEFKKVDKKARTKATTTPLVQKTFKGVFSNQLDKTNDELHLKGKRCGVCEVCQLPDCGKCNACKDMAKFGGHARTNKACTQRLCKQMAVEQADDSYLDDDNDFKIPVETKRRKKVPVPVKLNENNDKKIKWIGKPVQADETKIYYERVEIDGTEYCNGDFVMLEPTNPNIPAFVAKLGYMWKETTKSKMELFHAEVFFRSAETVLGEVGDPREVFLGDNCFHGAPVSSILRKASVEKKDILADWFKLGGKEVDEKAFEDDGKTYFYSKYYSRSTSRFEDLPDNPECPNFMRIHRYCPSCERKSKRDFQRIPRVDGRVFEQSIGVPVNRSEWTMVKWRGYEYKKGCGVFVKPFTFKLKNSYITYNANSKQKLEKVDANVYPEYYRKSENNLRGSNIDTRQPFGVAYIVAVTAKGEGLLITPQDIYLQVNVLYRPEHTKNRFPQREDLNMVYWSEEICEISFSSIQGPCYLVYEQNIPQSESLLEWFEKDPSRFYFSKCYDKSTGKIADVPDHAKAVGRSDIGQDKGKGTGKGKSKLSKSAEEQPHEDEVKIRPLRTLDVFAGCGGLSEGLHRAGVAECRWAVENSEAAAHAYSLNNKKCSVFNEDCNVLLKDVMSGATHNEQGVRLPMQNEVELIVGGPPCQGFSGMNRFNSGEYSNFQNSLVASYLSYCDYYRPKFFILENVRTFVTFKKGIILKLTLRALLAMGYQCTFGVLQAGHYGVPQTRRRLIILASAPGYSLPLYPEPTHVFSRRACSLGTSIDGKRFTTNIRWEGSAPRRTCCIHDAMGDLPEICNGENILEMEYDSMPESHFQRMVRSKDETVKLRDHICKNMAPLVQARITRIPLTPGSDWRDLPNISVTLPDGTKSKVLQYRHDDKRNGRSSSGALRGVCACVNGKPCSVADKQESTLIPWCLPHTGNRHNHWAGLYGNYTNVGCKPCSAADKQESTLITWCVPHTGNRHNHWAGLYGNYTNVGCKPCSAADKQESTLIPWCLPHTGNRHIHRAGLYGNYTNVGCKPCSAADKQENTLIPWCLPHTGNRHNHWAGLYGITPT
ncbi:Cytosine-specific methyltransferase [Operophtera brumata]|uniref:DNA (cytosine-5)-methyltransferase n=1 Tax=Operophtera brumata TaxID=104452 RepID=A0A0L7L3U4_OPEBR|nr:Cytosine-specific methyltransferase [Operophtera brumata]